MEYENPVLPGFHPDPSVCRDGTDFYLATSTFEYVPGVPLYHSRNLVDWTPIGHALTRQEQLQLADAGSSWGIFAPTLRYHDGTFYMVTTNVSGGGHFFVTADDPAGEWSDPTWVDAPGIDPDLFWDGEDAYFTYRAGDSGIEQATIDLATGELGEPQQLCNRLEGDYTEAPHLYEVDGTYYLIVAEGGTHVKHMVSVARAEHPTGPFEPFEDNPILSHRNVSGAYNPIQATGHGDLVRAHDGSWWIVFLGIRKHGEHPRWHHLGRETFLAPVEWVDGWPVVNDGDFVTESMVVEGTDLQRESAPHQWETEDAFTGELGLEWNSRNVPLEDRATVQDGTLELRPGPETLTDRRPTFLGRRQQHHDCRVESQLSFTGDESIDEDAIEAGLTVLMDDEHHYQLAVRPTATTNRVLTRLRVGPVSDVILEEEFPTGPITLSIEATAERYRFAAATPDGKTHPMGEAPTRYVSTEVTGGFTGVYLGAYATALAEDSSGGARFDSFTYRRSESHN